MAKKKAKSRAAAEKSVPEEKVLPQNILPMGERVEEDKNIYISQKVYKEIHKFTKNKTTNESGGMLVGYTLEEFGKTNIVITAFVEAKYCDATPTTLTFTHETWEYVHKEIDKKYPDDKIVGWIHTHPDFGIFLSEYDKFIHQNFFSEDHQIAYVVDPIQEIEGFYFWINGKLERCKGFYVYDKTGVKLDIDVPSEDDDEEEEEKGGRFSFKNILLAVLAVAVVFLLFANASQNKEIRALKTQQEALLTNANTMITYVQMMANEINTLKASLQATDADAGESESSDITAEDESGETSDETAPDTTEETEGDVNGDPEQATEDTPSEEGTQEDNTNE